MKRVALINLSTESQLVGAKVDHIEFQACDPKRERAKVERSCEFFPNKIKTETLPIRKIVDHGREHYICVSSKVWEYLYLIKNPVTAESQCKKIEALTNSSERWEKEAWQIGQQFKQYKKTMANPSLLTRIKWVFTGVN